MEIAIFNALLYVAALLIYYLHTRKTMDFGFVLLFAYALTAVTCVFWYAYNPVNWKLTTWPFIYLFGICILSFRPFFIYPSSYISENIKIRKLNVLNIFCYIFITCAITATFFSINDVIKNITTNDWVQIYSESGDKILYTTQLERFTKIFTQYLHPIATIALFYYLTLNRKKWLFLILLCISIIGSVFATAIIVGARGLIVIRFMSVFIGYIFFQKSYSKKLKRIILYFSSSILFIVLLYAFAVTESRFSNYYSTLDEKSSILYYLGHSMLAFDYGIADTIQKFMWGDFLFKTNMNLYYLGFDSTLGTHFGTQFFTFVGAWYLDFGPFGTLIIAILLPILLFSNFRKKKVFDIADLYLYFFFYMFLLNGVFVYGRGYFIQWVMSFAVYIILKIIRI